MSEKKSVKFGKYRIPMPSSLGWRIVLGILLCLGGLLWFLPLLGLWMLPLGLLVFSVDFPVARRFRRRAEVSGVPLYRRFRTRIGEWWGKWRSAR